MRSQVERCECSRDTVSLKRDEEHVRLLLRVSSMPLISTLQKMAHQANAEINYLVQRSKYNLYEEMQSEFPRLLSQPSVSDSIEELFQKLRNQLFVSTDLSPLRIEKEIQKAIQSFFMQLLAPTFICATTTTESVTQSYANCLRNNAPSWKIFYGSEQNELIAKLQRAILNYRIIEKTIDKLHRSVVEMETMNTSCIAGFTAAVYCDLDCSDLRRTSLPIRYCNDACINAVYNCLGDSVQHWNSFVTILRKLSVDFDYGFSQLEKEIINSVSYAFQIQAPSIARVVLKKCIALLSNQSTSAPLTVTDHYFSHPPAIEMKLISTIRKFTSYIGWWEKFAANLCADASRSSVCWNGTILISSAEINSQPDSALRSKPADVSSSFKVIEHEEGSGNGMDWSDDEDIGVEGSGSGHDQDEAIPAIEPVESDRHHDYVKPSTPSPTIVQQTTSISAETPEVVKEVRTKPPLVVSTSTPSKSAEHDSPIRLLLLVSLIVCVFI